jgi:putative chitinase
MNNKLNSYADVGDIKGMTKVINGGYNGLPEREENYKKALNILGT